MKETWERARRFFGGAALDPREEREELKLRLADAERHRDKLIDRLIEAQTEIHRQRLREVELRVQQAYLEEEKRRFEDERDQVEERSSQLMNLYVASYRLHESVSRQEVLAAIEEIVVNLIGSEEFGLLQASPEADGEPRFQLVSSFGLPPEAFHSLPSDPIDRAARGELILDDGGGESLAACIPLQLDGETVGVLAIVHLLPHKQGFQDVDHKLFELLSTQAASALYLSELHARQARPAEAVA